MKKGILVVLFFILSFSAYCDTENQSLTLANQYYDAENYEDAKNYFLKVISDGAYDGTVFYRLGYCLESLNEENSLMKKSYEASYYLLKKFDKDNPYYLKAEKKLKQYGLNFEISEQDLDNIVSKIKPSVFYKIWEIVKQFWYIFLGFGILIYILAYKLSENTNCVIVYGWKDFIIIAVGEFFVYLFRDSISEDITVLFIPMIFFVISILFSLIGNIRGSYRNGIFNIMLFSLISIITKIVLLIVIPIIIFCGIFAAASGKEDKRYKDGTKNNERTANIALFSVIKTLLFVPLMKTKDDLY